MKREDFSKHLHIVGCKTAHLPRVEDDVSLCYTRVRVLDASASCGLRALEMSTFGPWMQANVLPVDGLNTSAPASSSWQSSERPNLPEQLASIIHGPFWWLPLPILQDTALIAVNQPLSNSCLVIQNQRGTKTGQNHGKIKHSM